MDILKEFCILKNKCPNVIEFRCKIYSIVNKYDQLPSEYYEFLAHTFIDFGLLSDAEKFAIKAVENSKEYTIHSLSNKAIGLSLLARIAFESANHSEVDKIIRKLFVLGLHRANPLFIQYLFFLSYNPRKTARQQRSLASMYARSLEKGSCPRPVARPLGGRPLRLGYVSGDYRVHPVGLLLFSVLENHDPEKVTVFTYDTNASADSLTSNIKGNSTYRDVSMLCDDSFEELIRQDKIDLLVDLSGFTAYNRLPVFAREPAPCMVSWLGYWGTTGLSCMDAVLLDPWHAPEGAEKDFVEPIYRLPCVRFCYTPPRDSPEMTLLPPSLRNGYVTFGCFNNTAKYSDDLIRAWAEILRRIPTSRLILKWKTFFDEGMCNRIKRSFEALGVDPGRIELRGLSSFIKMLDEYNEVDIALDTFPFTGGLTTCNALWMGVPLVTLQGKSVSSRQGHAILSQIDLAELSATSVDQYVNIACGLAENPVLLTALRATLRPRMSQTPFLDVQKFTGHLEGAFYDIYNRRVARDHAS